MNYRVNSRHPENDAEGRTFAPGEIITDLDVDDDFNKGKIEDGVFVSEEDDAALDGRSDEDVIKEETEAGATDAAVKLAEESGIDLTDVKGTGTGGRITKEDVEQVINESDAESKGD